MLAAKVDGLVLQVELTKTVGTKSKLNGVTIIQMIEIQKSIRLKEDKFVLESANLFSIESGKQL